MIPVELLNISHYNMILLICQELFEKLIAKMQNSS